MGKEEDELYNRKNTEFHQLRTTKKGGGDGKYRNEETKGFSERLYTTRRLVGSGPKEGGGNLRRECAMEGEEEPEGGNNMLP